LSSRGKGNNKAGVIGSKDHPHEFIDSAGFPELLTLNYDMRRVMASHGEYDPTTGERGREKTGAGESERREREE